MTCKEKLIADHPEWLPIEFDSVLDYQCPHQYNYAPEPENCNVWTCTGCWDREVTPPLKSGSDYDKLKDTYERTIEELKKLSDSCKRLRVANVKLEKELKALRRTIKEDYERDCIAENDPEGLN